MKINMCVLFEVSTPQDAILINSVYYQQIQLQQGASFLTNKARKTYDQTIKSLDQRHPGFDLLPSAVAPPFGQLDDLEVHYASVRSARVCGRAYSDGQSGGQGKSAEDGTTGGSSHGTVSGPS